MSNVDLLGAGFTAIFGKHWQRPPRNGVLISINELFSQTYIMGPPLESVDPRLLFEVSLKGLTGEVTTLAVAEEYTIAQVKVAINKSLNACIPISEIHLFDNKTGTSLRDDLFPLGDYGIKSQYLLLTEFEVRTVSYGPSFFLRFMAQARSAREVSKIFIISLLCV